MTERRTVGELLGARRDALSLSDEQAGEQLGVSQSTFNRWRTGKFVPTEDRLEDVARWLMMPVDDVALALVHGRLTRPPEPEALNADVRAELRELRLRVARLERGDALDR